VWLRAFLALFKKINQKYPMAKLETKLKDEQGYPVEVGKTFHPRGNHNK